MNIKNCLIGGIVGGILFFFIGWLFYGILLGDYMAHNTGKIGNVARPFMAYQYLIAGSLMEGLLLAFIFDKAKVKTLAAGFVTGGIVGFLLAGSVDTIMYATTLVLSKHSMAADIAAYTVMSAIAGAGIAMVLGKVSKD